MVNVIAVFQDFWNTSIFYMYRNFGDLTIEKYLWTEKDIVIFTDRMSNLQGIRFPVLFELEYSGIIITVNSKGEPIFGGFIGNIFSSLAKKINARLDKSNFLVNTTFTRITHEGVMNRTIEMSGGCVGISPDNIKWYSYPIAMSDWSVMLPVESNIPIYKVFAFVFNWDAFAISIMVLVLLSLSLAAANKFSGSSFRYFFNIDCFRGMLGQSFTETPQPSCSTKIIYSQIFLHGIILVTTYNAFLQSLMTTPPKEKIIKSFDDLQASGLKIYIHLAEMKYLSKVRPDLIKKYSNLFQVETNFVALKEMRNSLNTNCAFIVTGMKAQSSGLADFWMKKSFYELLAAGKLKKLKFDLDPELERLKVEDLKLIWISMGFALMMGLYVFAMAEKLK
ncbi:uncharacterized protein LOC129918120 [Episyrphus balteatus]|uniref:uncharacterized protein LOC129918120 n=1 Tax=Episyrphus balteatus TaxID=286459 RepID=UPI0024864C93|nr:uncharacterized protein LOC129918120 [Episyrphus balteatus]